MREFLVLFVPILLLGLASLYFALAQPMNFIINTGLLVFAGLCFAIDIFALLVQYVNWRYYKE